MSSHALNKPDMPEFVDRDEPSDMSDINNLPVLNGYFDHPLHGPLMHPTFYTPRLCKRIGSRIKCSCSRNCFEIRVLMAVQAYEVRNISFRLAETIWGVSKATIHRRHQEMKLNKQSHLIFLLEAEEKPKRQNPSNGFSPSSCNMNL